MGNARVWGVAIWFVTSAASASCARDPGTARLGATVDGSTATVDPASARLAELGERFQVIAPGIGARFEPAGAHVVASIPADAKKAVRRSASVELPTSADGTVRLTDDASHVSIAFSMVEARPSKLVTTRDGMGLYAGAGPGGADVVHRVRAEGTEDFIVFESKPEREEVDYQVDVSQAAGLRLVSNVLEFLDTSGTPALRVNPPYAVDAGGHRSEATISVEGCLYDVNPEGPWERPVMAAGARSCAVRVAWRSAAYPAVLDPAWIATGSMIAARQYYTATALPSGRALVAGGLGSAGTELSSAELFDGTSTFAAAGPMTVARAYHSATLLQSGKVLIAGGGDGSGNNVLSTAELFNGTGTFAATGSMTTARYSHPAVLLSSGKVLVPGGITNGYIFLSSAELFDGTSTFTATGAMTSAREGHSATLLQSNKVLIAGGRSGPWLSTAELFDGISTFTATGSMTTAREAHSATLLPSGKVLMAGGQDYNGTTYVSMSSAEALRWHQYVRRHRLDVGRARVRHRYALAVRQGTRRGRHYRRRNHGPVERGAVRRDRNLRRYHHDVGGALLGRRNVAVVGSGARRGRVRRPRCLVERRAVRSGRSGRHLLDRRRLPVRVVRRRRRDLLRRRVPEQRCLRDLRGGNRRMPGDHEQRRPRDLYGHQDVQRKRDVRTEER
jgi:hypothetical protein